MDVLKLYLVIKLLIFSNRKLSAGYNSDGCAEGVLECNNIAANERSKTVSHNNKSAAGGGGRLRTSSWHSEPRLPPPPTALVLRSVRMHCRDHNRFIICYKYAQDLLLRHKKYCLFG